MNAAPWVLVGVLAGGSVAFFLGAFLGVVTARQRGPCDHCEQWQALVDEVEDELWKTQAELAKADAALADLNRQIGVVWDAGVYAGQTFQADRQENGL